MNKRNIVLLLAYDGTEFFGWQNNKRGPSIEGELQRALEQIYQSPCPLQAASRTDRGVHAEGQVVQFFAPKKRSLSTLQLSLNKLLPSSIVVLQILEAPLSFHPTLDAVKKRYVYRVFTGAAAPPLLRHMIWHYPYSLNYKKMCDAALLLEGTHNFQAFCNNRKDLRYKSFERTVENISISFDHELLTFSITGTSFLYKMVRNIVGTLLHVGRGMLSLEEVKKLLEQKNRSLAGVTAQAHGLVLEEIIYNSLSMGIPEGCEK